MGENFGEKIKRNVEKFGWLVSGGGTLEIVIRWNGSAVMALLCRLASAQ